MTEETKNLIKTKKTLTARIDEIDKESAVLSDKTVTLQRGLPEMDDIIAGLERERQSLQIDLLSERCSQSDIDTVSKKIEDAQRQRVSISDLMAAIPPRHRSLKDEKDAIRNRLTNLDRDIWQSILREIKGDISKVLGDRLTRAYGAYQLGHLGMDFRSFLGLFFESPGLDEVMRLQKEIADKHGIEI